MKRNVDSNKHEAIPRNPNLKHEASERKVEGERERREEREEKPCS